MPERVDNSGDWFFRSLITSAKLTRNTTNEQALHENKPRCTRQFESGYKADSGQVNANNFETDYLVILTGVRILEPSEVVGFGSLTVQVLFPTGAGISPFTRNPVFSFCGSSFYIPSGPSSDDWQNLDISTAVDWSNGNEWMLVNLGIPFPPVDDYRNGVTFNVRTAGFATPDDNPAPAAHVDFDSGYYFIFWHAYGAVAAYT